MSRIDTYFEGGSLACFCFHIASVFASSLLYVPRHRIEDVGSIVLHLLTLTVIAACFHGNKGLHVSLSLVRLSKGSNIRCGEGLGVHSGF